MTPGHDVLCFVTSGHQPPAGIPAAAPSSVAKRSIAAASTLTFASGRVFTGLLEVAGGREGVRQVIV